MASKTIEPINYLNNINRHLLVFNFCITSEDTTERSMNATCVVDSSSRERSCNGNGGHKGAHYIRDSEGDHLLAGVHSGSSSCVKIQF